MSLAMKLIGGGNNQTHQLGDAKSGEKPHKLKFKTDGLSDIAIGQQHTLALYENGDVYAAGNNSNGRIYKSQKIDGITKVDVGFKVKGIAASDRFSLYLAQNGDVYAAIENTFNPILIPNEAVQVFSNRKYAIIIDVNGSLFIQYYGKIDKFLREISLPKRIISFATSINHFHLLTEDGEVYSSISKYPQTCRFTRNNSLSGKNIIQLSGSGLHCLALADNGCVYACGRNNYHQLGNGTKLNSDTSFKQIAHNIHNIIQVQIGRNHSFLLTQDAELYAFGQNNFGQLLTEQSEDYTLPTLIDLKCKVRHIYQAADVSIVLCEDVVALDNAIIDHNAENEEIAALTERLNLLENEIRAKNDEIADLTARLNLAENGNNEKNEEIINLNTRLNLLENEIRAKNDEIANLTARLKFAENEIKKKNEEIAALETRLNATEKVDDNSPLLSDKILDPNDFNLIGPIHNGPITNWYLVERNKDHKQFAMKSYGNHELSCNDDSKHFIKENEILCSTKHPCVIKYLGMALQSSFNPAQIYYEYIPNGTLENIIRTKPDEWTSTSKAICILDIVLGMSHVHSKGIIHRNLKPSNILCINFEHFKVSDFNLSTFTYLEITKTKQIGDEGFKSPEIEQGEDYDEKTDVFSFGSVLYNIITEKVPNVSTNDIINGKRAEIPPNVSPLASDIITRCWLHIPSDRPSFNDILIMLELNIFKIFDDVDPDHVFRAMHKIFGV